VEKGRLRGITGGNGPLLGKVFPRTKPEKKGEKTFGSWGWAGKRGTKGKVLEKESKHRSGRMAGYRKGIRKVPTKKAAGEGAFPLPETGKEPWYVWRKKMVMGGKGGQTKGGRPES